MAADTWVPVLHSELERLKLALGLTDELDVDWAPDAAKALEGEVQGRVIHLYSSTPEAAVETLRHEVVDYAVAKAIAPYKDVTNALMGVINQAAYAEKERLVEKLCKLLD